MGLVSFFMSIFDGVTLSFMHQYPTNMRMQKYGFLQANCCVCGRSNLQGITMSTLDILLMLTLWSI